MYTYLLATDGSATDRMGIIISDKQITGVGTKVGRLVGKHARDR